MRDRLPLGLRRAVRPRLLGARRGLEPVSDRWGKDRGTPLDRYYIERFLAEHREDIRGRALEVKDDGYVRRFGRDVDVVDVLDVDATNPLATVVADLSSADAIPDEGYQCFVLTQTLQYICAVGAAVKQARRILAPGGVLLATVPSITRVTTEAPGLVDYWRFTEASCHAVFGAEFGSENVTVGAHGNLVVSAAFLAGLAAEELSAHELDTVDHRYPIVLTVRAVRA